MQIRSALETDTVKDISQRDTKTAPPDDNTKIPTRLIAGFNDGGMVQEGTVYDSIIKFERRTCYRSKGKKDRIYLSINKKSIVVSNREA
ncbi:Arpin [Dirofilaria immitis]